jgi:hypothetical protein
MIWMTSLTLMQTLEWGVSKSRTGQLEQWLEGDSGWGSQLEIFVAPDPVAPIADDVQLWLGPWDTEGASQDRAGAV